MTLIESDAVRERRERIEALKQKCYVPVLQSKFFKLLDTLKIDKEYAPIDPSAEQPVRWTPAWAAAIAEHGQTWAGNSELLAYVLDRDDEFRAALTAVAIADPTRVIPFIADDVRHLSEEYEWNESGEEIA